MMTIALLAGLMIVLLLLKGFFSGSEIAMVSADSLKLRHWAAQGKPGARLALRLLKSPPKLLTTTLLGTNVTSIALTTIGTLLFVSLFGEFGEELALLVFTPLFLIFGEIVPKSIYQQKASEIAAKISFPLSWLQVVFAPLIWLFSITAILAARMVGGRTESTSALYDQFVTTIHMAEKSGASAAFQRGQIRRVMRFAQMSAAQAMWPMTGVHTASHEAPVSEIVAIRKMSGQKLVPLWERTPGNITCVARLESFDMLDPKVADRPIEDFLAPVEFVAHIQRVSEIFEILNERPDTTMIVVDDMGNALGLITMSLIMRRTLGAKTSPLTDRLVAQQHPNVSQREDGRLELNAAITLIKLGEVLEEDFSTEGHSTLNGLLVSNLGRIPKTGDQVTVKGHHFEVREATERSASIVVVGETEV